LAARTIDLIGGQLRVPQLEASQQTVRTLVLTLDVIGTFVFALSGAAAGIRARLDLFGILVLSFAAASSGGVMRDLLIGSVPPAAVKEWWYVAVSLAAGLIMFYWHPRFHRLRSIILWFDAAGLAVFAVAGAQKALAFGIGPVQAALLGMLTGIGGGVVRDILVNETPTVLRGELYAVAALAGALIVVVGDVAQFHPTALAGGGALLCFTIRIIAIRRGWRLPTSRADGDV
jgi:uncharacterized membrane protein YeiH